LDEKSSPGALFAAYESVNGDADVFRENLEAVKGIFKRHKYPLSGDDIGRIEFVYQVFFRGGPAINYSFASASPAASTPSYTQIATMSDDDGHKWNYLATEESFRYVREMQRKNLFVPLVGDFSGPTTIRSIARYLKEHNANVSAFYASNVETYLDDQQIRRFYTSLLSLPVDSTTTTIRYVDFMHNTEIPWWNPSLAYLQVVSPISVLANLASGGKMPAYNDVLRLIPDPSPGRTIPRFTLPANLGAGRLSLTIAINPQAGGVFQTSVPIGTIQVGPAVGLPPAFAVKSITYGHVNVLRESMTVTPTDDAELVITLAPAGGAR
jgi:hypothetical protein